MTKITLTPEQRSQLLDLMLSKALPISANRLKRSNEEIDQEVEDFIKEIEEIGDQDVGTT
jgi:hypothetical protein